MHPGAGAYICGEETALIEALEGKRGFPRIKPPFFPAVAGLYGEPTVVNNVETMSNLPWIVHQRRRGLRRAGRRALDGHAPVRPGRAACSNPGVFEVEMVKNTFRDLIFDPALGGGVIDDRPVKAFIPGGVSAPWFGPDLLDLPLGQDEVAEKGSMLGSGSIVVMDDTTCSVRAAWRITKFFSRESCGQCTPCREGSGWIERVMCRLEHGGGRAGGRRPAARPVRQHRPGADLAAPADDHLRAGSVDPVVDPLGDPDVPRRLRRPRDQRRVPL